MTGTLLHQVARVEVLKRAWGDVLENDLEDGSMQARVLDLAVDIRDQLVELSAEILDGTYRPRDLVEVKIPKKTSGKRTLHIPDARDRIVERAILNTIGPLVDPLLGPAAFGYRPGLGVKHAARAVAELREEGLIWVLRADVLDCFPSLDYARIRDLLGRTICDERLLAMIGRLNERCAVGGGRRYSIPGLPQGSPLSPLLCNLALVEFDEALLNAGFPLVRYADDLTVCCRSEADARRSQRIASEALKGIGMELNENKSKVMSFAEGFCFLGEDFGPKYPLVIDESQGDCGRRTLFVGRQGSRVRMKSGRIVVDSKDGAALLDVPQGQVERLVCFGAVGVSAGVRQWALSSDVQVVFLSRNGHYDGQLLASATKQRPARLRAQLSMSQEHRLRIAKEIVSAKAMKQKILLQRYLRPDNADGLSPKVALIGEISLQLSECESRDQMMGVEGAVARVYFEGLAALLPDGITFSGRNRRPPTDVMNAALSYLYTILLGECVGALVGAGLDPAFGCLHAESNGKPALGLDLIEEFRPYVVDLVVLQMARRKSLTDQDAVRQNGKSGVTLSKAAKLRLIDAYESRMQRSSNGALPGFGGSIRQHVHRQAVRLGKAIQTADGEFTGLSWR